jgi:large subunit ribosomal protein L30
MAAEATTGTSAQHLRITQVRSVIGHPQSQRRVVQALGLRRMHQTVVHHDTASIRGMVAKVHHLIAVEEVPGEAVMTRTQTGTQRFQARLAKKAAEREALLRELGLLGDDEETDAAES